MSVVRLSTVASACPHPSLSPPDPSTHYCEQTSPQLTPPLPVACRAWVRHSAVHQPNVNRVDVSDTTFRAFSRTRTSKYQLLICKVCLVPLGLRHRASPSNHMQSGCPAIAHLTPRETLAKPPCPLPPACP